VINTLRNIFRKFDLEIISSRRNADLIRLEPYSLLAEDVSDNIKREWLDLWHKSNAQLKQDLFVLAVCSFKNNGYFVEFGATNGVNLSNSYLLEKEFSWNGILAEPGRSWHEDLRKNRSVNICEKCVWKTSDSKLLFNETNDGELSTIDAFSKSDGHSTDRKSGRKYDVQTITLAELLDSYSAPHRIDYLSIDTEGSEYSILKAFDFKSYSFNAITVEHNFGLM